MLHNNFNLHNAPSCEYRVHCDYLDMRALCRGSPCQCEDTVFCGVHYVQRLSMCCQPGIARFGMVDNLIALLSVEEQSCYLE